MQIVDSTNSNLKSVQIHEQTESGFDTKNDIGCKQFAVSQVFKERHTTMCGEICALSILPHLITVQPTLLVFLH
jgi:hypothetical protein